MKEIDGYLIVEAVGGLKNEKDLNDYGAFFGRNDGSCNNGRFHKLYS